MHQQQDSRQHWKAEPGLLGETVLGRALLFLGSTFQTAIFLLAIQSFPNKDSFQGQAGGKKNAGSSYNRVACALQGEIFVLSLASLERYSRARGQGCPVELIKELRK